MSDEKPDKHIPKQLIPYLFKPGQSGNPNGRPKVKVVSEYVREKLADIDEKTGKPVGELIAETIINQSVIGLKDAVATLLDRTEGKVAQTYQIDSRELKITGSLEDLNQLIAMIEEQREGHDEPIEVEGKTIEPSDDLGPKFPEIIKEEKSSLPQGFGTVNDKPFVYLEPRVNKPKPKQDNPFASDSFGTLQEDEYTGPRGLGNRRR